MFGGIMAYIEGRPLASLSDVGIGLKLARADLAEGLELEGAEMLRYAPEAPASKSYLRLPDALVADDAALSDWLGRGVEFVLTLPTKKR